MLDEWFRKNPNGDEKPSKWELLNNKKKQLIIIIISLGLLALIWPSSKVENNKTTGICSSIEVKEGNISKSMAQELESILTKIDGVGAVDVSLSLSSDGTKSYLTNTREEKRDIKEADNKGMKKNTLEENLTRDLAVSSGTPLLIEEKRPEILGVLVVANGANNSEVAEQLISATATLFNISPHKVTVMPRKGGG
ncbi:MAG: hypothetical protein GX333_06885 [Syntrophomonadaceae bacterium]|nr:hypothetical protein [Syntrophomonadaceae bacterium]